MILKFITLVSLTALAVGLPAVAQPVDAYCTLAWHDSDKGSMEGDCRFSQHQGNVYVDDFNYYNFVFPAAEQGKTYTRDNKPERVSFRREGNYTLNVFQGGKPMREPGGF